jgi:hypothetical protein
MRNKIKVATPNRGAEKVRVIAQGIFDKAERATVLKFVDACEKMAEQAREKP